VAQDVAKIWQFSARPFGLTIQYRFFRKNLQVNIIHYNCAICAAERGDAWRRRTPLLGWGAGHGGKFIPSISII